MEREGMKVSPELKDALARKGRMAFLDIETAHVEVADQEDRAFLDEYRDGRYAGTRGALHPLTGMVTAAAVWIVDERNPLLAGGKVYAVRSPNDRGNQEIESAAWREEFPKWLLCVYSTEEEVLRSVWDDLSGVAGVVTWGGDVFDLSFLRIRSAVRGVMVPKVPVSLDMRTFMACGRDGDSMGLAWASRVFGLSGKGYHDSSRMPATWWSGGTEDVATHCRRDVEAILGIYGACVLSWGGAAL